MSVGMHQAYIRQPCHHLHTDSVRAGKLCAIAAPQLIRSLWLLITWCMSLAKRITAIHQPSSPLMGTSGSQRGTQHSCAGLFYWIDHITLFSKIIDTRVLNKRDS